MIGQVFRTFLLAAGALILAAVPVRAENLLLTQIPRQQQFTAPGNLVLFPSGSFFQSFVTSEEQVVMISFSAVCGTSGTTNQYTRIEINIGGTTVYPTNQADDAFCSVAGSPSAQVGRAESSLVTGIELPAGVHTMNIRVIPVNGGVSRIDNLTLVVWN